MTTTSQIPGAMRTCVLTRPGELRLEERPVPQPGPGQVLVAVRSVGVCGSDVHYYTRGRIGEFVVTGPLVLGHEGSGQIVAARPGVDAAPPGPRVPVEPRAACGRCA